MMQNAYGKLIRRLREKQGLTLKDVATAIGISQAYLSEVERFKRSPFTLELNKKLAEVLKCDVDQLDIEAAVSKGHFTLESFDLSPKAEKVGAMLMRHWLELTDAELEEIHKIITPRS